MFSGDARATITTEMGEEEFHDKVREAFETLGDVDIDDGGDISISPKASIVSFMSTLTVTGKVKGTDDGYKVDIDYSIAPSTTLWLLTVLLFCLVFPVGAVIIIAPMLTDKPNVAKAAENALRDLKDSFASKKKKSKAKASDDDDDDD